MQNLSLIKFVKILNEHYRDITRMADPTPIDQNAIALKHIIISYLVSSTKLHFKTIPLEILWFSFYYVPKNSITLAAQRSCA